MKKKTLISVSVLFAFGVLGMSVVRYSRQGVKDTSYGPENMATRSGDLKEYYLPYPGVLPDHPLYVLKMVRDKGRLFLQKNSFNKAELYIYYADKRIGAAEVLLRGGKLELAELTADKAEQYLGNAFEEIRSLDEDNEDVRDLWVKFYRSASSHHGVLLGMMEMVEGDARVSLEKILTSCMMYRNEVGGRLGWDEQVSGFEEIESEEFDMDKGYL